VALVIFFCSDSNNKCYDGLKNRSKYYEEKKGFTFRILVSGDFHYSAGRGEGFCLHPDRSFRPGNSQWTTIALENRDASNVLNKLMYFNGKKYNFIGLINSTDASGQEIWGGLNEKGLAIINSQADDLALSQKKFDGADNGLFMKLALGECATVDEVEKLLQREKGRYDLAAILG